MKKLLSLLILSLIAFCVNAQIENAIPARPNPPKLVNDYAGLLTTEQQHALERKLVAYDDSTSSQIAIVIVEDMKGYEAVEYAVALGRKWGIGGREHNNGVLILISKNTRDAFIAPGYGLEGAIPDITAKTIVDHDIIPNFKEGNYYRGLDEATDDIIRAAAGEYKAPKGYNKKGKKSDAFKGIAGFLIVLFIIIFSIIGRGGGRGGGMASRRGWGDIGTGWIIGSILGGMGRGGSGGGGGWSGGGGGGFGGFGGGGFGGGGAGGKW